MEYNPYTAQVREQSAIIGALKIEAAEHREQLAWYDRFDPQAALQQAVAEAERTSRERTELQQTVDDAHDRLRRARPLKWLRLYPPALLVRQVRESGKEERSSKAVFTAGSLRLQELEEESDRATDGVAHQRKEAERHSTFDRHAVLARACELEAEIEGRTPSLDAIKDRESRLQEKLAEPEKALVKFRTELGDLKQKKVLAEGYLKELDDAPDGRVRARIHRHAEADLGDGRPSRFISGSRGKIDQLERQVRKLEERVQGIVRQGTLEVRALILDGSNLCHAGSEKIGLFALRALAPHLRDGREVQVVFDASVLRLLGLTRERLESELSDFPVHVVDGKSTADKIILRLASEPGAYVLSNDRFLDYPEMLAVSENRIIGVEFIGRGRAIIDDLDIDVEFTRER